MENNKILTQVVEDESVNEVLDDMHIDYDTMLSGDFDPNKLLEALGAIDTEPSEEIIEESSNEEDDIDPVEYINSLELEGIKASDIPEYDWNPDPSTEEERTKKAEENFLKAASSEYQIGDDDGMKLLRVIMRTKNGEKFNVYEALPESMQKEIIKVLQEIERPATPYNKEEQAKSIIDGMVSELNLEKELVDFQESFDKEFNIPEIGEFYSEALRSQMEEELLKIADTMEEEFPEKAMSLRKVSQAYTDSYNYNRIIDALENNPKVRNRITKDNKNYKRFCDDINRKMKNSEFIIKDSNLIVDSMKKVLNTDKYKERDFQNFVIAFAKTCDKLSANRIEDCAYIYYTIRNITDLGFTTQANTNFSKQIINNIENTLDKIKEVESYYLEMKADRPVKKSKKSK